MKTKIKISVIIGLCLESEIKLLDLCLSQCLRHSHPDYDVIYYIADQTDFKERVGSVVGKYPELQTVIVSTPRVDAGYFIDYVLEHGIGIRQTDYIINLDVDALPISRGWLDVSYMESNHRYVQMGTDTFLSEAYPALPKFTHLNNYYRIQRTIDALAWSRDYGFRRPTSGHWVDNGVRVSLGIKLNPTNDRCWKWNFGITRAIGETPGYGLYGFVLGERVLHICFGSTAEVDFPDLQKRFEMLGKDYLNMVNVLQYWGDSREDLNRIADHLNTSAVENIFRPLFNKTGAIGL